MIRAEFILKHPKAQLPIYATAGSSGADVFAALDETVKIAPGAFCLIPTGLQLAYLSENAEIQIRPRSGLALKHGISIVNSPGTIDADYRGEIGVILINHSKKLFKVKPGNRIAQFVYAPVFRAAQNIATEIEATERGAGGFGSTGVSQ